MKTKIEKRLLDKLKVQELKAWLKSRHVEPLRSRKPELVDQVKDYFTEYK